MGYSPQGLKESDMTERLTLSLHFSLDHAASQRTNLVPGPGHREKSQISRAAVWGLRDELHSRHLTRGRRCARRGAPGRAELRAVAGAPRGPLLYPAGLPTQPSSLFS